MAIEGVGPVTATALIASVFKSGRQFAAWLGLTLRQNSSGGKTDRKNRWLEALNERTCANVAAAAAALTAKNDNAIFAMLSRGTEY